MRRMMGKVYRNKQLGMVSLFAVIFSMLLITVVTVGFARIMIISQQQSSSDDLSQSAYDSALVGVEDAKRAILRYKNICDSGTSADCDAAKTTINSSTCNTAVEALSDITPTDNEIKIQTTTSSGANSNNLDQAYTCVKVQLNTDDYLGSLANNESKIIPLKGSDVINTVTVQWFSSQDLSSAKTTSLSLLNTPSLSANWKANTPSIMRAQLIQFNSTIGFQLSDFANNDTAKGAGSSTLFLYPSAIGLNKTAFILDDRSRNSTSTKDNILQLTKCSSDNLNNNGYACTMQITLPTSIAASDTGAFLYLTTLYGKTHYRITLSNVDATGTSTPVKFSMVQPEVDSTGRANTLFRRVKARVELTNTNYPYPEAAINIAGNLCKNFVITDNASDYSNSCTP